MKRSGPLRRTGRVNPISEKREKRDAELPQQRYLVWRRAAGRCEFRTDEHGRCRRPMVDVHHLAGRRGPNPHRLSNLVGLCRQHHEHIETQRRGWAYEHGWLVRRNQRATESDDAT